MRQREAGGAQADDQHLVAGRGLGHGALEIQRIPARQQAVDLEAPGQLQNILERAGLDLRNVHRLLLLINARLHAVIADAVAGAGAHGIVDGDDAQRADGVAVLLDHVHLGDLLFERAAGERDAENAVLVLAGFLAQAGRATVLALVVALDAVMRLVERAGQVHAGIGELEALAMPVMLGMELQLRHAVFEQRFDRHQMIGIDLVRDAETGHPSYVSAARRA